MYTYTHLFICVFVYIYYHIMYQSYTICQISYIISWGSASTAAPAESNVM